MIRVLQGRTNPRFAAVTALVLASGCATPRENIPRYPLESADVTLATVQARTAALSSVTGRGAVTLNDPKRGSVRLDAAFVLAPPDRARVRAWKFNQAVLDLTVTPDGVWLYSPRDPNAATTKPGNNVAGGIREWLRYLNGGVATERGEVKTTEREILVTTPQSAGGTLTTTVDRTTRTVRSYRLTDATGVERFTLTLGRYRLFDQTLWPGRIEAHAPSGLIIVETSELQPNVAATTAFKPPARAKRLP